MLKSSHDFKFVAIDNYFTYQYVVDIDSVQWIRIHSICIEPNFAIQNLHIDIFTKAQKRKNMSWLSLCFITLMVSSNNMALQLRNMSHGFSNHAQFECLFNSSFTLKTKKMSKHCITSPGFPAQRASNAKCFTMAWCLHASPVDFTMVLNWRHLHGPRVGYLYITMTS